MMSNVVVVLLVFRTAEPWLEGSKKRRFRTRVHEEEFKEPELRMDLGRAAESYLD